MSSSNKKGQITVFLIIGVVVLALFAGIYYLISDTQTKTLEAEGKKPVSLTVKSQVENFVSNCVKQVAVPGFYLLGIQGGLIYADDPTKVLVTENGLINYGYLDGVNQFSTKKINKDMSIYLNDSLDACLKNFSFFKTQGIVIKPVEDLQVFTTLGKKEVVIKIKYPLAVEVGNSSLKINDFSTKIPIRLGTIMDQAKKIIVQHKQNPSYLEMNQFTTWDTFVNVFPFDEETTIYSISDSQSIIRTAPFAFMFAIKDTKTNTAPELQYISDRLLKVGVKWLKQLEAEDLDGDLLSFSSDSKLFPISEDGLINITASVPGTYDIKFEVKDSQGLKDSQKVKVTVEK